jgi:hypothetical protein
MQRALFGRRLPYCNEELNDPTATFQEHVLAIAQHKMQTLNLPAPSSTNSSYLYALTADTLVRNTITPLPP